LDNQEHCHSRNISVNCFYINDEMMAVEGSLKDERLSKSGTNKSNQSHQKDTIHHMFVKMNISLPQLKIISISADLATIPNEACDGAKNSVNKLIGLQIKHGFTDAVRNLLANQEGCAHMMNLILSMGSAAVQGAWSALSRRTVRDKMPEIDETIMINSCWLWREDGPLATKMKASKRQK
jgi:hypothetical protein